MKFELREIASKAAGTYFIVTDNSAVQEIEQTSNLRVFFINSEFGPVNTAVFFKQGALSSFENIFGKRSRKREKQGNYSIKSCLEALKTSSIVVVNLRKFDDKKDKTNIFGMSPSNSEQSTLTVPYTKLFNLNSLWRQESNNVIDEFTKKGSKHYLNFGNVGSQNISIFVTQAKREDYELLTNNGDETLSETKIKIDEYPALVADDSLKIKDTMVTVWIFNNTFDTNSTTNRYYGNLFEATGMLSVDNLEKLSKIPESGFNLKITGSLIPNIKSEFGDEMSIDTKVNVQYANTGLICSINTDLLELEDLNDRPVINHNLQNVYDDEFGFNGTGMYLSHRLQPVNKTDVYDGSAEFQQKDKNGLMLTATSFKQIGTDKDTVKYVTNKIGSGQLEDETEVKEKVDKIKNIVKLGKLTDVFEAFKVSFDAGPVTFDAENRNKMYLPVEFGLNIGSTISIKKDNKVIWLTVTRITEHTDIVEERFLNHEKAEEKSTTKLYTRALYEFNGLIPDDVKDFVFYKGIKNNGKSLVQFTNIGSYKKRDEQFTDGTAEKQSEILDMMLHPSIVKGLKKFPGIRYFVDCFKSFVEAGYKYQFGELCYQLDKNNKFMRAILNEPFIKDLERSVNPIFKQSADDVFSLNYIKTGGNENLSTKFLTKFERGGMMCYFFGSVLASDGKTEEISSVIVSNKFIGKSYPWDVVANDSGYIEINGLPLDPDDDERRAMELFKWNPIIKNSRGFTIFGNTTGQKKKTSLSQIHNSELLAYIKESLYNMARDEHFKKGTYSEYLQTEVRIKDFMDNLALQNAIEANPVVICNFENNTRDIQKQLIKLIQIEYTNVNALDKVVFDLTVN